MKLSVITDEIDPDLRLSLSVMAEYGITGAELRQIGAKHVIDMSDYELQQVRNILDEFGAHVVGIASPFYKCDLPGVSIEGPAGNLHAASAVGLADQIDVLTRSIRVARFFGTNLVRIFSFWKRGTLTPEIESTIVDAFSEPVEIAENAGIILGLENEHACYIGTGSQAARFLGEVNSPALRAIWDPGNAFFDGEIPYPDGYNAVREYVAHIHIKDASSNATVAEPQWTVVGEGHIDYAGQFKALRSAGYDGYLSLETHYNGHETKIASSRACLDGLVRLFRNSETSA